jgi:hypothetical protein
MKNRTIIYLSYSLILVSLLACNNPIQIIPSSETPKDSTLNLNFKVIPDNDFYNSKVGIYKANLELYLRAFESIAPKTPITIKFKPNNFAVLVIAKDTLYPDDEIKLLFSDFKNYRYFADYYTIYGGKQKVEFDLMVGGTRLVGGCGFENR